MATAFHAVAAARPRLPLAAFACLCPGPGPATRRKLRLTSTAASTMDAASASSSDAKKMTTVFVAGSTGRTGKRVVEKLLERGFGVVAGTTDVGRASGSLPEDPNLHLVRADVTEGAEKLVMRSVAPTPSSVRRGSGGRSIPLLHGRVHLRGGN